MDENKTLDTTQPQAPTNAESTIDASQTEKTEQAATQSPAQPTVTQPVQPQTPAIDADEIEAKVTEKVHKSVIEKIAESLGITKKEEVEKIPTDPKELKEYIAEHGRKAAEQVLTEREQAEKQEKEAYQKQVSEGAQRFQTLWKNQYDQLAESGRVPKITNPGDKNDPGNVAKVKILTKLAQVLKENQEKGIDYVPTLKEVFYENPDILTTATTTGADVPISGNGRAMAQGQGLTYDQLHKANTEDLVKAKYG